MPPHETRVFLFGTLRDAALARIVFGADLPLRPALLTGHVVRRAAGGDWPALIPEPEGTAEGACVALPPLALERADFYEALFGYRRRSVVADTPDGPLAAECWFSAAAQPASDAPWSLADWQAGPADLARAAAADALAHFGTHNAAAVARRMPMIRARAQARLNARETAPTDLRRRAAEGDVVIEAHRTPYAGFFAVEEYDLRHARFGGGMSERLTRAAFISADAVTVLPYDPVHDRVLLIEQFRMGPLARGDAQCWSLEAIAGRIDAGETPEQAAFREAREEAGLDLARLIPLASYYPTPGAKAEYIHSFLALAHLPSLDTRIGGVDDEHEDIRAHVVSFERLMALFESGEVNNAPLLLSALGLKAQRDALRGESG